MTSQVRNLRCRSIACSISITTLDPGAGLELFNIMNELMKEMTQIPGDNRHVL